MGTGSGHTSQHMGDSKQGSVPVPIFHTLSEVDEVGFLLPVGLQEDAVDVVDFDGFVGGADGLDHAADAEIAAWRRTPSAERTMRSTAGRVKVLCPSPTRSSSRKRKSRMASGPKRLVMTE